MSRILPERLAQALRIDFRQKKIIAERCKVSQSQVSHWITGHRPIPTKYNKIICFTLDRRITALTEPMEEEK